MKRFPRLDFRKIKFARILNHNVNFDTMARAHVIEVSVFSNVQSRL